MSYDQGWKNTHPPRGQKNSIGKIVKTIFKRLFKGSGKMNSRELLKKVIAFCVVAGLFGSLVLVAAFGYYSRQLPDIHTILTRFVAESTKIYDRTGEVLLFEVHGDEKRTIVELDQVSDHIENALIAAEDKNFYHHNGFSLIGIARAAIKNTFTGSSQGGSTLTQQMIKNTVLTKEKTYTRKIKELILARKAEQEFSKEEILKIYLNTINYGGVNYGVEAASQAFFGKRAADVSLSEAAILAAIPQAPTRLSPYGNNLDQLMARKDWVLDRMEEEGYISKEERDDAKQTEIAFQELRIADIKAPHFVFYVQELLAEEFGEDVVSAGGLKVITSLDWNLQEQAESIVNEADEFNRSKGATDAALVTMNAKTGEILAMVGSQDYFNDEIDGQVNVAIEPRQPGSSIKPIVYAAAIEKGYTDKTVVYDSVTNFAVSGTPYQPNNYDLKERGPVTFRSALQGSLNIPAVKALYLTGVDRVMEKMEKELGYHTITKDLDCGLSLVLGGCEVTLLDHVSAYTAFARDGERAAPGAILEVYDSEGDKLFEFEPQTNKVWDNQVARTMNNILSDNEARAPYFGGATPLVLGERPVAAKTGTTNDYNDAWTIGYTPSYVTGVWVGNADGTDMKGAGGLTVASPIWNRMMKAIGGPVEYFKGPDPLPGDLKPVLSGNVQGTVEVEVDKFSGKLATEYTPDSAKEKRTYAQHHTILHYLLKDDPRGPAPEDPASADPAYSQWERYVQEWVQRDLEKRKKEAQEKGEEFNEDVFNEAPPTEYDDVHKPEYAPSISILSPSNNTEISNPQISISVNAYAPRGLSRVEYYVDDQLIATSFGGDYGFNGNITNVTDGFHTLRAVAYDDVDNASEASIELNFKLGYIAPTASFSSPRPNSVTTESAFPIPVSFSVSRIAGLSEIVLYYEKDGVQNVITNFRNLTETNLSTQWTAALGPGEYSLFVRFMESAGGSVDSEKISVTIQ